MGSIYLKFMQSVRKFMLKVIVYEMLHFPTRYIFKRRERALKKVIQAEHLQLLFFSYKKEKNLMTTDTSRIEKGITPEVISILTNLFLEHLPEADISFLISYIWNVLQV